MKQKPLLPLINKRALKNVLGGLPLAPEAYWRIRQQGKPLSKSFSLRRLSNWLPECSAQAAAARSQAAPNGSAPPQRILVFSTLRYWVEQAALMSLALAGLGHDVTLAYLPYANWRQPINRFDLRRQNAYARYVLGEAAPLLKTISFLDVRPSNAPLPLQLAEAVRQVSLRDVQYTLQVEEVDFNSALYRLRLERNTAAARAALVWLQAHRPDAVITPNGSILEMGVVYAAARSLAIPVVTYEFGEQRGRIWFARNAEVMRQETDDLWAARSSTPLSPEQWEQIKALYASRQQGRLWENFARLWQGVPNQGGEAVRRTLDLDHRPVALLAANVIGDSLTLGRQVFSTSMTEWLERTVQYFARRPDVQLVVRIHPGERYTQGPSVADLVRRVLPDLADGCHPHIHLVAADDPVNTYDLVEIADLGLVYTTTVGMEMAMAGVPVIVAGQTHYRGKGFTVDPASWEDYARLLEEMLRQGPAAAPDAAGQAGVPRQLARAQVEQAWNYAYRFFFEYPCPFPWHLLNYGPDLERWPVERVLSVEGQEQFGAAFRGLAGEPRQWQAAPLAGGELAAGLSQDVAGFRLVNDG